MWKKEKANAHDQPREGQSLLSKQQKVTHSQPQGPPQVTSTIKMPRGSVTQTQRLSVSDLPPLHGPQLPLEPPCQLSPQMQRAASARLKLPPLPAAAASGSPPRGTAHVVGSVASGYQELMTPSPWGTLAAGGAWETPSLASRTEGFWHGSAARQDHRLPPVQPAHSVQICTGSQPAWQHLGHSETEVLLKLLEGHGSSTCSDVFRDLGPCLRENRPIESTQRTTKWLSGRQGAEAIHRPAKQSAHRKQLCPEDDEAVMLRLCKMSKQLEEMEDKVYDVMFRDIFSSLEDKESPVRSTCISRDPPSPTLKPAVGPSDLHSASSVTEVAAGETQKFSQLVSLDQLLAELDPVADNSMPSDALVKGSTGEAENNTEIAHPDLLEQLCSVSGDSPSSTLLNQVLEIWDEEELHDRAAPGEMQSEPESALSLPTQEEEEEETAPAADGDPCNEGHSEPLPMALPEEAKMSLVCASPAETVEEIEVEWLEAGCAQAAPPQEEPRRAGEPAGACPLPAQPLARSAPACPAGSAAVPQPPAPRPWRSIAKTARRALL
ncbi:uncharacterized protein LOC111925084 [Cyanistes caeruleus]|uniref:uncharacterized protein LOC111925084 n=1 Tax=Cyanistes caeruleus TaxID=156563 RepID=UPI000CDB2D64|nr:uncharacterized protein LOC111925084 [Cyanistes caeruleus]